MKLYYTRTSPYARKVRIAAIEKGLLDKIELVEVNLREKTDELFATNPLGKIPALVTDDGQVIFDSPVICEYLEEIKLELSLYSKGKEKYAVLTLAAMADGLMDSAVALFVEDKLRPGEKRFDKMSEKHLADVQRVLSVLDKKVAELSKFNIASIAAAAALGYLSFRHADMGWPEKHKKLAAWFAEFSKRESLKQTEPGK